MVNHWLQEVVYHTSYEYTAFVTGRERIKKIKGEVVATDKVRSITSASEQAAESLATLKDVSNVSFEQTVAEAHQDQGLTPASIASMETKKEANVAQLSAAKACRAANETKIEPDQERARGTSLPTDHLRLQRAPTIAPL
jgi:hypothetical protein